MDLSRSISFFDFFGVLVGFSKLDAFLEAERDSGWVIIMFGWVEHRFDVHIWIGFSELDGWVPSFSTNQVDPESCLWGAVMLGIEDAVMEGITFFTKL